ncbi:hypothetical protein C1645_866174 [Glomus cerebriforme]|uniref:BTB domain-containing protein n=1 Tax=Glomus cerebriforme TaxID=658196 RepID=A0A397TR71_9GLOM|nr:hypothetical protein C1645_866174 [Glomus cerebriforme]
MKIETNINNSSPRGRSLEDDFKRLICDERFHDIALKCSDGETIYGCKAILATRSDVFNSSIFTKSEDNKLSFDDINSTAMKIILEFLYTSKVDKESLTVNNVIEVYYASIYFDLVDLQNRIIDFTKEFLMDGDDDVGKKLLSECVEKFSLKVDNEISKILVKWVAKNKLERSKIDSLSLEGLRYLLEKTFDAQIPFATPEFNIWEYALTKVTTNVIQNETFILNEESYSQCNSQEIEGIKNNLITLIDYINLNRMDSEEIKQHVEPFNVFSIEKIKDIFFLQLKDEGLELIRGVPIFKWKKNESDTSDDKVIISNNGFVVEELKQPKSILGDLNFKSNRSNGIYEWDILVEKLCGIIYIGICDINEDLKKDQTYHGWVLGSDGYIYHEGKWKWYDAKYKGGDKVTVHLDMKNKTCAFSINNIKKPIVPEWNNIPSQVRPIASLGHGSKLCIKAHMKN